MPTEMYKQYTTQLINDDSYFSHLNISSVHFEFSKKEIFSKKSSVLLFDCSIH